MKKKLSFLLVGASLLCSCGAHTHNYVKTVVAPTCLAAGYDYYECSCGEHYQNNEVKALGHDHSVLLEERFDTLEANKGDLIYKCSRCEDTKSTHLSSINDVDHGVSSFLMEGYDYSSFFSGAYDEEGYILSILVSEDSFSVGVNFSFIADQGLKEYKDYRIKVNIAGGSNFSIYDGSAYVAASKNLVDVDINEIEDEDYAYRIDLTFYYEQFGLIYEKAFGNFAFFPFAINGTKTINYTNANYSYVLEDYPLTWIKASPNDRFYYDNGFEHYQEPNWTRPDFTEGIDHHLAYSITEYSVEASKVAMMSATRLGATCIDLHLEGLNKSGLLTSANLINLFKCTNLPVLAIFYDGNLSQQARLDGLILAANNGASAVDLQGFMYWEGSTLNTQTAENIAYWEGKGFDMSFVSSKPVETILDQTGIESQKTFIASIHAAGAKVLLSSHNKAVYTASQALAYAKFIKDRGVDVVKLVGYGNYKSDIEECINANKICKAQLGIPFTFHLNSTENMKITRVVCPLIYGAFMAFCYYNQTHLDMMLELESGNVPAPDTPLDDVIPYLKKNTSNSEIDSIITSYQQVPTKPEYVTKAYGASSTMDSRWTVDEANKSAHIQFRDASGTNKFSIRGYQNYVTNKGKNYSYRVTMSGNASCFASTTRSPKAGIFLGNETKMVALTYRNDTKSVSLDYNEKVFNYDTSPVGDRLVSLDLVNETLNKDVFAGDKVNLGIVLTSSSLLCYASSGSDSLGLIATIPLTSISSYIGLDDNNDIVVGNIFEVYMGSSSVGSVNSLDYTNIVFESLN